MVKVVLLKLGAVVAFLTALGYGLLALVIAFQDDESASGAVLLAGAALFAFVCLSNASDLLRRRHDDDVAALDA